MDVIGKTRPFTQMTGEDCKLKYDRIPGPNLRLSQRMSSSLRGFPGDQLHGQSRHSGSAPVKTGGDQLPSMKGQPSA